MRDDSIYKFESDNGNEVKNWSKHKVRKTECEEVFLNEPLLVHEDKKHSQHEFRYIALGRTTCSRKLMIVYTIRNEKIRVISARDMSRKERVSYEKYT